MGWRLLAMEHTLKLNLFAFRRMNVHQFTLVLPLLGMVTGENNASPCFPLLSCNSTSIFPKGRVNNESKTFKEPVNMQMMMLFMYLFFTSITLYNEYLLQSEKLKQKKRLCIPS